MPVASYQEWFGPPMAAEEAKRRSVSGIVVTFFRRVGIRLIQFGSLFVLARLLTPGDFGLIAMITAAIGLGALLADMALSEVTIRLPVLTHAQASNLFWIKLTGAVFITVIGMLGAPFLQKFYGDPHIRLGSMVLIVGILLNALGAQHDALLRRMLRFTAVARIELLSATMVATVSLWSACNGLGYWSLVAGSLAGSVVTTLLLWTACSWRPGWPSRGVGMSVIFHMAMRLNGYNIMGFVAGNLSNLIIGRSWGAAATGQFGRANNLQSLLLSSAWEPLDIVAGPTMARLVSQPDQLCNFYYKLSTLLVIAGIPIAFIGLVLPHELIRVMFGPQWDTSAEILRLLAIGVIPHLICHPSGWVYFSIGNPRTVMWWGLFGWGAMIIGTLIGAQFGVEGMAIAATATVTLLTFPCMVVAFRGTPLRLGTLGRMLAGPLSAGLVAGIICAFLLEQVAITDALQRLIFGGGAFLSLYGVLLMTVFGQRRLIFDTLALLRPRTVMAA